MDKLEWHLEVGEGRLKVSLAAGRMGTGIVVFLDNAACHIGAVAVSEFDHKEGRASTSVITLLGHKDDAVAYEAAREICRRLRIPVCVVAGVHLDDIKLEEIKGIVDSARGAVKRFVALVESHSKTS